MSTAIPPALDDRLRLTIFCYNSKSRDSSAEFMSVELVGYENDEAGSPLALDNGVVHI